MIRDKAGAVSNNFDRTLRQRAQKRAPVRLGHDAIIENNDDALVALGSDQAPHTLSHFQDRFRQRVLCKWVAAALIHELELRFNERMIGHGKRQPCDNHIRERLARNIDTAPKTVGAKEYTSRR